MKTHRDHPKAKEVYRLSKEGKTSVIVADLLRLDVPTVRLIKLCYFDPVRYMEWWSLDQKRQQQEHQEEKAFAKAVKEKLTEEDKEACRLAKQFPGVDKSGLL